MKLIRIIIFGLLLAAACATQAAERLFAVVDYMHIPENSTEERYIALEKLWQRLHQKSVDQGICRGWYLHRVENGGRNQFVTVRIYDSLAKASAPWTAEMAKGLYSADEETLMNKTGEIRDLTRSEVWELEAAAEPKEGARPETVYVEYMKPKQGKTDAYYAAEKNFFQKIHQARIKAGRMTAWFFLSRMFPNGTDGEYDFVTVNGYGSKGPSWDEKLAKETVGEEAWNKAVDPTELRESVRTEIWHMVQRTSAPK